MAARAVVSHSLQKNTLQFVEIELPGRKITSGGTRQGVGGEEGAEKEKVRTQVQQSTAKR